MLKIDEMANFLNFPFEVEYESHGFFDYDKSGNGFALTLFWPGIFNIQDMLQRVF